MRLAAFTVLSLGAVLACADATAPATPRISLTPSLVTITREHDRFAFEQTVNNTCAGELVRITATLHLLDKEVTMADGEIRTVFHTNFQNAVGVGLTSGKTYRASAEDNSTWQGAHSGGGIQGGPWRTSHAATLHLVVPGEGASFSLRMLFIVTKEPGSPADFIVAKFEVTCH